MTDRLAEDAGTMLWGQQRAVTQNKALSVRLRRQANFEHARDNTDTARLLDEAADVLGGEDKDQ